MVIKNPTVYGEHSQTILFKVDGIVLEGKKKGKALGFPTANIPADGSAPAGIYAGEVVWRGTTYPAAIYKGDTKNTVEAHLLDFSENLYGEKITIIAEQKIRDSRIFSSRDELVAAIAKDIEDIRKIIADVK